MISVLSQEGHAKVGVYEYVIDTVAELSNVPTDVHAGSMVYCIENSKKYMLNNSGTYVEVNFKKGGSGGEAKLGSKDISENGTYRASEFDLDGWSQVNVDVENTYHLTDEGKVVNNGALVAQTSTTKAANGTYDTTTNNQVVINVPEPSGIKNIDSNGIYDVTNFASASVAVPGASGTTNITSNGIYDIASFASANVSVPTGVFPSGTKSIAENGIYDITNFSSVDINVSGGGGGDHDVEDSIIMRTISGAYTNSTVTSVGDYAFYYCSALTSMNLPNVTTIGDRAFYGCSALTSMNLPNVTTIGNSAFYSCSNLKYLAFDSFERTHTSSIFRNLFVETFSFRTLNYIADYMFNGCSYLTSLYLLGSVVPSAPNATQFVRAFSYTPITDSSYTGSFGKIYVPASLMDDYKASGLWSRYADRIIAYEGE